mmetsp:Transcript_21050/g.58807  ORF Transcript_21050/g.58807 Transcript_21050/m.58807 type:complete len:225 (-) Transcript_21050:241-915(-)
MRLSRLRWGNTSIIPTRLSPPLPLELHSSLALCFFIETCCRSRCVLGAIRQWRPLCLPKQWRPLGPSRVFGVRGWAGLAETQPEGRRDGVEVRALIVDVACAALHGRGNRRIGKRRLAAAGTCVLRAAGRRQNRSGAKWSGRHPTLLARTFVGCMRCGGRWLHLCRHGRRLSKLRGIRRLLSHRRRRHAEENAHADQEDKVQQRPRRKGGVAIGVCVSQLAENR